jgi:HK97 family phage prohead protease
MSKFLDMKYDAIHFKALGKDAPNGSFEAITAAFGNVDRYREVLVSGAVDESLATALPPVVWSHDWLTPPVGTTAEMAEISRAQVESLTGKELPPEVTSGLYGKGQMFVDDVPLAKHIYTALKAKNGDGGTALSQFSVGLNVIKEGYEKRENDMVVVLLEKCDLVEWGSCLKGINPATYNIATKADDIRRLVTKGLITPDDLRTALEVDIQGGADLKKALPVSNLGFAARGAVFDNDGARRRVKEYATDDDGNVDFDTYSKAFLWVDDGKGAASNLTSYRFVVADVVGDELRYIPKGIFAAAGVLNGARGGTNISKAGQAALKQSVEKLYAKMATHFDDDTIAVNWKAETTPEERRVLADLLFA